MINFVARAALLLRAARATHENTGPTYRGAFGLVAMTGVYFAPSLTFRLGVRRCDLKVAGPLVRALFISQPMSGWYGSPLTTV